MRAGWWSSLFYRGQPKRSTQIGLRAHASLARLGLATDGAGSIRLRHNPALVKPRRAIVWSSPSRQAGPGSTRGVAANFPTSRPRSLYGIFKLVSELVRPRRPRFPDDASTAAGHSRAPGRWVGLLRVFLCRGPRATLMAGGLSTVGSTVPNTKVRDDPSRRRPPHLNLPLDQ